MSSDDGIRMLYLDFGGKDGELVSTFSCKNETIVACDYCKALIPARLLWCSVLEFMVWDRH